MTTLVGRDATMATLSDAVRSLAGGSGGCLVLQGPAGIGKSRLLAETTPVAAARGIAVAVGRATELDQVAPLAALSRALRSSQPAIMDAEAAGILRHHASRIWLIDRLTEVIEVSSRERPLLVALDDLQWIDELTALALRSIVPAVQDSPVLWLLAGRPTATRSPARVAVDSLVTGGAVRLGLPALPESAVVALCRELLHAPPGPSLRQLATRAGGNPFLLEELFTTLRRTGRVQIRDGIATVVADDLPDTFVAAVDSRLGDLSHEARRLVEAGAVLGRPFTLHEAAGLVGWSAVHLVPAAQETVASGVLVAQGAEFTFRHDLIREAVYNATPAPVRTTMHRETTTILQRQGRPITEVAKHILRGGGKAGTDWTVILQDAAAGLASETPGTAADLLLRARELVGEQDPARARLTADAVALLASAGRIAEAREVGEAALLSRLSSEAEAQLLRGLAQAVKHAGQDALVVEYARRGLQLPGVPEATRAHLLAVQAHALLQVAGLTAADRAGSAAVASGHATGEHAAAVFGGVARSVVARARGELDAAVRLASDAAELADSAVGDARQYHPRLWLGRALIAADRFADAETELERCRAEVDRLGTAWAQPLRHRYLAELRHAQGRLDDARAEVEAGLRIADQLDATALTPALLALLAELALLRDDRAAAERDLTRAEKLAADGHGVAVEDLTWVRAQLQLARGDDERAFHTLAPLYQALPEQVGLFLLAPRAASVLVRLARLSGAAPLARQVVRAISQAAERNPTTCLVAAAAHAAGVGDDDLSALRRATTLYANGQRPLDLAAALVDTAAAEQHAGQRQRATRLWREARDIYLATGARRNAGLLPVPLPGRSATPQRGRTGWDGLTASELRVVRLVAEGLTNREVAARLFLSRHTVDSHLRHAFAKLGISRRVELTREVVARDAPTRRAHGDVD